MPGDTAGNTAPPAAEESKTVTPADDASKNVDDIFAQMNAPEGAINPAKDSVLQKVCRWYGCIVGRRPRTVMGLTFLMYMIFIIVGFTREKDFMNEDVMELQWAESGGKLEQGVRIFQEKYSNWGDGNEWDSLKHMSMMVAKGTSKPLNDDEDLTDIATIGHFTEMLEIHKDIHALKVEIPNPNYPYVRRLEENATPEVVAQAENVEVNDDIESMVKRFLSSNQTTTTGAPTTTAAPAPTTTTPTTTQGPMLEYSYYDLCYRGILPDLPPGAGSVVMPCMVISPLSCFKEAGDVNHPVYQFLDPNIQSLIPTNLPFSTRPSILHANSSDNTIKDALSALLNPAAPLGDPGSTRGCFGDSIHKKYSNELIAGRTKWYTQGGKGVEDNTNMKIKSAGGYRSLFMIEAAPIASYRMQIVKPEHAAPALVKQATKKLTAKIHEVLMAWNDKSVYLEVASLPPDFSQEFEEEVNKGDNFLLFLGFLFNFFFCCYTLVHFRHPQASRASVGLSGLFLIVWSEFAAFGLYLALGRSFNGPMIIALPVLGLGIGLDDMFVLIRYFSSLGFDTITMYTPEEVTGETFKNAGVGTTLTSLCNVLAFTCGCFLPIEAMADFCLGAAILAVINYITNVNILLPLLRKEIDRIVDERPDPHPFTYFCHKKALDADKSGISKRASITATNASSFSNSWEKRMIIWLKESYAPTLCRPVIATLLTATAGVLVYLSITAINDMTVGWAPQSLLPEDMYLNRAMELIFDVFSTFPVTLIVDSVDVPSKQIEILQLVRQLTDTHYTDPGMAPNLLTLLYLTQFAGYQAATAAAMPTNATAAQIGGATIGAMMAGPPKLDMSYTDPAFAPFGTFTTNSDDWYAIYNSWKNIPTNPIQAWNKPAHGFSFIYADIGGANRMHYNADNKIDLFTVDLFQTKLNEEMKFLDCIRDTHAAIKDSPLSEHAHVYGPIPVFWEVFMNLDQKLATLLWIDMGLVFVITFLFFEFDILAALITAASCGMIVIHAYGMSCALMNFNIFVAVFVLMAMGMSVEFTCHFAAAFSMGQGSDASITDRLGEAMSHVFPALTEGIISTFLSVLPLAWHATLFTRQYVFGIIMIVVGAGTLNGMIFMPAMLSLLDPLWKNLCPTRKKMDQRVKEHDAEIERRASARHSARYTDSQELKVSEAA